MKKVFFVRHGESEGNIGEIQQTPETPLTSRGFAQADIIGKRVSRIDFDVLISSSYVRALQTAGRISSITGKAIIQNELFVERVRPSEQVGNKKALNAESEKLYLEAWIKGEKYKDGESFKDLVDRAKAALEFLESIPEEVGVVVTHGIFLRVILSVVLLGEYVTPQTCDRFIWLLKTQNTGITEIEKTNGTWRVVTWNDHAHLG